MIRPLSKFCFSDMTVTYLIDEESGAVGLRLVPKGMEKQAAVKPHDPLESLIQAKIIGDAYPGNYASGRTMRWSATTAGMRFEKQERTEKEGRVLVHTALTDSRGLHWHHTLEHRPGAAYLTVAAAVENCSAQPVTLEMLSSFALGGLTPFCEGEGTGRLTVHRIRSNWSSEGFVESRTAEEMHLERAWLRQCAAIERFGQLGSMPVRQFFPLLGLEDRAAGVTWAAELTNSSSWQMEIGRRDDGMVMDGGLADREFGGWLKTVAPGQRFDAPEAILTVCVGDFDIASQRLIGYTRDRLVQPQSELDLPVLFNEFCTTWGVPQEDLIRCIVDAVKPLGLRYFVIDCGWYAEKENDPWWDNVGSWNVSPFLFKRGLEDTLNYIRDAGMKPGIWFEAESIGCRNPLFEKTEWLLHRDGLPLQVGSRRFLDFRLPQVRAYVREKVIGFLKKYRIDYIKTDYNDSIGLGADGADSLAEGLREHIEAVRDFLNELRAALPQTVLEICSSGGHRLAPSFLTIGAMGSFSDAHECEEIPLIAAHEQRFVWPAQSQIWAVLHKEFDEQALYYKLTAGLLGRLCLSGDVLELTPVQWEPVQKTVALYRKASSVIENGVSRFFGLDSPSWRHPTGWQAVIRQYENRALIVFHTFHSAPNQVLVPIPECFRITDAACREGISFQITEEGLLISGLRDNDGIALLGESL